MFFLNHHRLLSEADYRPKFSVTHLQLPCTLTSRICLSSAIHHSLSAFANYLILNL